MGTTKPLGLGGLLFAVLSLAVGWWLPEYESIGIALIIVGAILFVLWLCSWHWKWEIVSRAVSPDWTGFETYMYFARTSFARENENQLDWFKEILQAAK